MAADVSLVADRHAFFDTRVLKQVIERRLGALVPPSRRGSGIEAAMRYALLAPGKRIRPILTVLTACEIGGQDHRALDAGCALEMIHAASLILDDLPAMDNAPERRGQAATHIKFGEDVAMLSAISLLSTAYATVAAMDGIDATTRCALVGILAKAVGIKGLVGGQYADLRPGTVRDAGGIVDANHRKTGALFVAAIDMAAAIHRLDDTAAAPLRSCAAELGQAYQLLDDLADSQPRDDDGGHEDLGKATLIALLGQDEVRTRLRRHVDVAVANLHPAGPMSAFMRDLFDAEAFAARPA